MKIPRIQLGDIKDETTGKERFWKRKWLLALVVAVCFLALAIGIPGLIVVSKIREVYGQSQKLIEAVKTKDLKLIEERIGSTKSSLASLDKSLLPLAWTRLIPFIGAYEADAVHLVRAGEAGLEAGEIVVASVAPYADIVGFTGGQEGGGEKTAEDRINFIVTTIDKLGPDIEKVGQKFSVARAEVDQISPGRYPLEFRGRKIREPLTEMISLIDQAAALTFDAKPVLEVAPFLLGIDAPRRYLVIFQNDAELRPTGGFMTAYAILEVDKGKIKTVLSEDMYALDARFGKRIPAPEPITNYLTNIPYWNLRDMNLSPDFKVSMEIFSENFQKASNQKFDGIIAVDTKVLARLLEALGQIGVPGWGNFSAEPDSRCDGCPQVVYELERLITKPTYEIKVARKAVIGPLMHSILANAFGSPKDRLPGLFNAAFSSLLEKHVLFYFPDEKVQSAMESFNLAGRIKEHEGDYFHLNDTNFGGAKSNMFIKQAVDQKIEIGNDGTVTKIVTIEYKNPSPHSAGCDPEAGGLCLNALYRDWFRLYVPQGSSLIESQGSEVEVKTYEELGKTVFEGYYGKKAPLHPNGGMVKLVFKYQLPFKVKNGKEYRLLIQKQPGTEGHQYSVQIGRQGQEFELKTDKELKFKI